MRGMKQLKMTRTVRRWLTYGCLTCLTGLLLLVGPMVQRAVSEVTPPEVTLPVVAAAPPASFPGATPDDGSTAADSLAKRVLLGKQHYQNSQFAAAIQIWEQLLPSAAATETVQLYRYLSIAHQDLGQWAEAERRLAEAFAQTSSDPLTQAQLLNTRGRLQFNQGQAEAALESWAAAATLYQQLNDAQGIALSQINQAQALRSLGQYRRAQQLLSRLQDQLELLDDPVLTVALKRSLSLTLMTAGDLNEAQRLLLDSLALAPDVETAAATRYQLGRVYEALEQPAEALEQFAIASRSLNLRTATESELAELRLLTTHDPAAAASRIMSLRSRLLQLPPSRWSLYGQIHLVESWRQLLSASSTFSSAAPSTARLLAQTVQQARAIEDARAEALALVALGQLYERTQQWSDGLALTEDAIALATPRQAEDILVKAQWQRGRLLKAQGQTDKAISAYSAAVDQLQQVRQDLVAMNPEVQFSFRDQVEPIYRELTQLLLENAHSLPLPQQQQPLRAARDTIEALQLAELQNFFREACRNYSSQSIDTIDQGAAVVYAIVLDNSLEVIFSRPDQPLQHHHTELTETALTETFTELRQSLNPAFLASESLPPSQRVYDWLVRPFETELQETQTLVFVLDDILRDVPMAVLHDGQQYLIEKYAVVLTPGLQLFESEPLTGKNLSLLAGGLTEARQGFSSLPGVAEEIDKIRQKVSGQTLVDERFTRDRIQTQLAEKSFSVVHFGTHGQFSSNFAETFLLTWDSRMGIQDLRQWLPQGQTPLELLILSACQTAKGDSRATLGLAGLTLQAGARSTIATLWAVQDRSTAELMAAVYDGLVNPSSSRAVALQQAQQQMLNSEAFSHPYYWSGFVLVGNWL